MSDLYLRGRTPSDGHHTTASSYYGYSNDEMRSSQETNGNYLAAERYSDRSPPYTQQLHNRGPNQYDDRGLVRDQRDSQANPTLAQDYQRRMQESRDSGRIPWQQRQGYSAAANPPDPRESAFRPSYNDSSGRGYAANMQQVEGSMSRVGLHNANTYPTPMQQGRDWPASSLPSTSTHPYVSPPTASAQRPSAGGGEGWMQPTTLGSMTKKHYKEVSIDTGEENNSEGSEIDVDEEIERRTFAGGRGTIGSHSTFAAMPLDPQGAGSPSASMMRYPDSISHAESSSPGDPRRTEIEGTQSSYVSKYMTDFSESRPSQQSGTVSRYSSYPSGRSTEQRDDSVQYQSSTRPLSSPSAGLDRHIKQGSALRKVGQLDIPLVPDLKALRSQPNASTSFIHGGSNQPPPSQRRTLTTQEIIAAGGLNGRPTVSGDTSTMTWGFAGTFPVHEGESYQQAPYIPGPGMQQQQQLESSRGSPPRRSGHLQGDGGAAAGAASPPRHAASVPSGQNVKRESSGEPRYRAPSTSLPSVPRKPGQEYDIVWNGGPLGLKLRSDGSSRSIPVISAVTGNGTAVGIQNAAPGDILISINGKPFHTEYDETIKYIMSIDGAVRLRFQVVPDEWERRGSVLGPLPQLDAMVSTVESLAQRGGITPYYLMWRGGRLGFSLKKDPNMGNLTRISKIIPQINQNVEGFEKTSVGDVLCAVNGQDTLKMSFREIISLIKRSEMPMVLRFLRLKPEGRKRASSKHVDMGDLNEYIVVWNGAPLGISLATGKVENSPPFIHEITNPNAAPGLAYAQPGDELITIDGINTSELGYEKTIELLKQVREDTVLVFRRDYSGPRGKPGTLRHVVGSLFQSQS